MDLKHIIYFGKRQFLSELHSPKVILGYLIALTGIFQVIRPYMGYVGEMNKIQLGEVFILLFNTKFSISYLLLGLFLVLSDAPFMNAVNFTAIYRSRRNNWLFGMFTYILLQTMTYYGFILAGSFLLSMSKAFIVNAWSRPFYNLVFYKPAAAMEQWGLWYPSEYLLERFTPWEAVFHSFMLIFLYSMILAIILFIFNLNYHWIVGSVLTFGIHFIGYIIANNSMFIQARFSLFANSILEWHDGLTDYMMTVSFSYILYGIILFVLIIVASWMIKYTDFRASVSGKL